MNEQQQAQALARWLTEGAQGEPPAGIDPEVLDGLYAVRPDLAPRARVTASEILDGVDVAPWSSASDPSDNVVPFPVPASAPEPSPKPQAIPRRWGPALGAMVALAASVLLVVRQQPTTTPQTAELATIDAAAPEGLDLPSAEPPPAAAREASSPDLRRPPEPERSRVDAAPRPPPSPPSPKPAAPPKPRTTAGSEPPATREAPAVAAAPVAPVSREPSPATSEMSPRRALSSNALDEVSVRPTARAEGGTLRQPEDALLEQAAELAPTEPLRAARLLASAIRPPASHGQDIAEIAVGYARQGGDPQLARELAQAGIDLAPDSPRAETLRALTATLSQAPP